MVLSWAGDVVRGLRHLDTGCCYSGRMEEILEFSDCVGWWTMDCNYSWTKSSEPEKIVEVSLFARRPK